MALPVAVPFRQDWEPSEQGDGRGAVIPVVFKAIQFIDCKLSSAFSLTMTATATSINMVDARPGQIVDLYLKQDASGSRLVTTWTDVLWAAGSIPSAVSTGANALDWFRFTWNATLAKWLGEFVGKAMA